MAFSKIPVSSNLDLFTTYLIYFAKSYYFKVFCLTWNNLIEGRIWMREMFKRAANYINAIYIIKIM